MLSRRANDLKVSDFISHADGTFDGGSSASDKITPNIFKMYIDIMLFIFP